MRDHGNKNESGIIMDACDMSHLVIIITTFHCFRAGFLYCNVLSGGN